MLFVGIKLFIAKVNVLKKGKQKNDKTVKMERVTIVLTRNSLVPVNITYLSLRKKLVVFKINAVNIRAGKKVNKSAV